MTAQPKTPKSKSKSKLSKAQVTALAKIIEADDKRELCFVQSFHTITLSKLLNHTPPLAQKGMHSRALYGIVKPTDAGRAALAQNAAAKEAQS